MYQKMIIILLYIDPGSGSLLFQLILSGLVTSLIYFKRVIHFLKFKFKKKSNSDLIDEFLNKND
jgi:hypothetical protein